MVPFLKGKNRKNELKHDFAHAHKIDSLVLSSKVDKKAKSIFVFQEINKV